MRLVLAVATAIAVLMGSATAARADTSVPPPTGRVTVDLVVVTGNGCRNVLNVFVAPDNSAIRMYGSLTAKAGGGARPIEARQYCQIGMIIRVPSGYTWAFDRIDHHGFADVQRGATGLFRRHHFFAGQPARPIKTDRFPGPFSDAWHLADTYADAELTYVPCGMSPLISTNVEVRVDKGTSDPATMSFVSVGSDDGGLSDYHFAWRRCP